MFLKPPLKVNIHDGSDDDSGKSEKVWNFVSEVDSFFIPDVLINLSDFDEGENNKEKGKVTAEVCDHISCKGKVDKLEELEKILFTR